jgi:hypothetical protein
VSAADDLDIVNLFLTGVRPLRIARIPKHAPLKLRAGSPPGLARLPPRLRVATRINLRDNPAADARGPIYSRSPARKRNAQDITMQKPNETKRSMKLMRGGMTFAVLAIVLVISGIGAGALLLIPCVLMMSTVMWITMRGAGGNPPRGRGAK